jgi:dTDP-4-amino-4,6-dideoxygalactose transaminase
MVEVIRHSSSTVSAADFRYLRNLAKQNYVGYGALCKELERQLESRFSRHCVVLTGSGEGALTLALAQLKSRLPRKKEVVVSSYVCPSVVNAILSQELRPIFADIGSRSLNLNVEDVKKGRITNRTLAILCTHIGGIPDDIHAVMQLGVPVISDCAQSIGATIAGRSLLALGDMAVTSFGPTKFLTGGLGGAVFCEEREEISLSRLAMPELSVAEYREHGFVQTWGQHFSELNAGLVLAQLQHLPSFVQKRKRIAKRYDKVLRTVPGLDLPERPANAEPNWFRYYFFSDRADEWLRHLQQSGVDARGSIAHVMTEYFSNIGKRSELSGHAKKVVSLPIYPGLTTEQISRIVEILQRIATKHMGAA